MPPVTAGKRKGMEEVHWLLKGLLPLTASPRTGQVCWACLPSNHSPRMPYSCHLSFADSFVLCIAGLSFNQPNAGRETRAQWVIASYFQHFLTWKMIQWGVELEGFQVFSVFRYSPELSGYPLQFVKLGIISVLCLIIGGLQVNIDYPRAADDDAPLCLRKAKLRISDLPWGGQSPRMDKNG